MENKPISIILEELRQNIISAVNDTGLDISVVSYVVRDISREFDNAANSKYISDLRKHRKNQI